MSGVIREGEWLKELERLSRKNDEGQTAEELANAMGRGVGIVRNLIAQAMAAGWVTVGRRSKLRIDGKNNLVPVYLIRKPTTGRTRTTSGGSRPAASSRRSR